MAKFTFDLNVKTDLGYDNFYPKTVIKQVVGLSQELSEKISTSLLGQANGVATLDSQKVLEASQIPAWIAAGGYNHAGSISTATYNLSTFVTELKQNLLAGQNAGSRKGWFKVIDVAACTVSFSNTADTTYVISPGDEGGSTSGFVLENMDVITFSGHSFETAVTPTVTIPTSQNFTKAIVETLPYNYTEASFPAYPTVGSPSIDLSASNIPIVMATAGTQTYNGFDMGSASFLSILNDRILAKITQLPEGTGATAYAKIRVAYFYDAENNTYSGYSIVVPFTYTYILGKQNFKFSIMNNTYNVATKTASGITKLTSATNAGIYNASTNPGGVKASGSEVLTEAFIDSSSYRTTDLNGILDADKNKLALAGHLHGNYQASNALITHLTTQTVTNKNMLVANGTNWITTTPANVLSNIGAQPLSAVLTSIAGKGTANSMLYASSLNTYSEVTTTSFGRDLLKEETSSILAKIGAHGANAVLTNFQGLASTKNNFLVGSAAGAWSSVSPSDARTALDVLSSSQVTTHRPHIRFTPDATIAAAEEGTIMFANVSTYVV